MGSYRPHKRKRATTLKGKCIEYIGDNLEAVFKEEVLDIKLREQILDYLCESPILVELPDGPAPPPPGTRVRFRLAWRTRAYASAWRMQPVPLRCASCVELECFFREFSTLPLDGGLPGASL